jgi:hypothetical protein
MKIPAFLLCLLLAGSVRAQEDNLTIGVNEGIELMSLVQYLGGHLENNTPSPYRSDVQQYFWKYRNEPAVKDIFEAKYKIYSDLVECGIAFYNFPDIRMHRLPDSCSWIKHIGRDSLDRYMRDCMQFYRVSRFHDFYTAHLPMYQQWGKGLRDSIGETVRIFDSLINTRRDHHWVIYMDPLNDWGAHTITPRNINPEFANCFMYQLGYFGDTDKLGNMAFNADLYNFGWHEGTHAFTDSILEKFKGNIDSLAFLMPHSGALNGQNINDWPHYFNELIANSVSAALHKQFRKDDYDALIKRDTRSGFVHIQLVSDVIYENFIHARKVDNFEGLMPLIFAALRKNGVD